jgi:hypothetical protein
MKVTGSGPVASNREINQGSSWFVSPAEEEEEVYLFTYFYSESD